MPKVVKEKKPPKIIEPKPQSPCGHNTEFTKAELKKIAKREDKRLVKEALKVERKAIKIAMKLEKSIEK